MALPYDWVVTLAAAGPPHARDAPFDYCWSLLNIYREAHVVLMYIGKPPTGGLVVQVPSPHGREQLLPGCAA